MTVYVITSGSYSDYCIRCVTDNPLKAEVLRKSYSNRWEDANIEEYEIVSDVSDLERTLKAYYKIVLDRYGNAVECIERTIPDNTENYFSFSHDMGCFYAFVASDSKDKALKIARDVRMKMLSEKFGL